MLIQIIEWVPALPSSLTTCVEVSWQALSVLRTFAVPLLGKLGEIPVNSVLSTHSRVAVDTFQTSRQIHVKVWNENHQSSVTLCMEKDFYAVSFFSQTWPFYVIFQQFSFFLLKMWTNVLPYLVSVVEGHVWILWDPTGVSVRQVNGRTPSHRTVKVIITLVNPITHDFEGK